MMLGECGAEVISPALVSVLGQDFLVKALNQPDVPLLDPIGIAWWAISPRLVRSHRISPVAVAA
jgi:hypothetical protein